MSQEIAAPAASVASPTRKRNIPALFWGVIRHPHATFAYLREHGGASWLWPALLLVALIVTSIIVTSPITQRLQEREVEQLEQQGIDISSEQFQQIQTFTIVAQGVGGVIGLAIGWLIQAAVWHFASLATGGQSRFGAMFRAGVWASALPGALRLLVTTIGSVTTGSILRSGLGALVSMPENPLAIDPATAALAAFLGGIDIFWLWAMVLSTIAVAVTAQFSWRKGLLVTVGYWLLTVIVSVGFVALGASINAQFAGGAGN